MPALIKLRSPSHGEFEFDANELPLVGRRISRERKSTQGHSHKVISLTLDGFFRGNNHNEVMDKFNSLYQKCNDNILFITYNDGSNSILDDRRVYLDFINEPGDWKQYIGDYHIDLHYFEETTSLTEDLEISASFTPTNNNGSSVPNQQTYTFNPVPLWSSQTRIDRQNSYQSRFLSDDMTRIGEEVYITLTGFLTANSHNEMHAKIEDLRNSFKYDGILNYGNWTNDVRVISGPSINETFPLNHVDYTISVVYCTEDVRKLTSKISASRIHNFPKIRDRIYCNRRTIKEFGLKAGQYVTYDVKVESKNAATALTFLDNEVANMIIPGGIEMPGGTQASSDSDCSAEAHIVKFYDNAVIPNIDI